MGILSSGNRHDTTVGTSDGGDIGLTINGGRQPTTELIEEVEAACARVEDGPDNPVIVLRVGTASGEDDAETAAPVAIHLVNRWERALRRLERVNAVTLAVAEGRCGGPALEALLSSDYRIGGPELRIASSTEYGASWPGMAVHRLASQLGVAKARQLVLFGGELTADEAVAVGLVNEITDDVPGALAARIELARRLTGTEIAIRRRLLLEATSTSFEDALGTHLAACDRTLRRQHDRAAS